jgi:ADP-ribosyl-[dinitrogen reductase] hydrolase
MITIQDRFKGSFLGLAVGDALGAPVEFKPRKSFPYVTDYMDGGPFNLKKGQWTDDTSLALCIAHSLLERSGFDPFDQVEKYLKWFREGYLSCTGNCFDIGNTTKAALLRYEEKKEVFAGSPDDPPSNGSLMRLAPIPLYFFPDEAAVIHYAGLSSKVTHAPIACIEACETLAKMIFIALEGKSKDEIFRSIDNSILDKSYEELSGKGEAKTCLESALWCFYHSTSFEEGLLMAVNLGDDTDTTGAVYGQLAGAFYGINGIPKKYLDGLWEKEMLLKVANSLFTKDFL